MICEKLEYGWLCLKMFEGVFFNFGDSGFEVEMYIYDWFVVILFVVCGDVGMGEIYIVGFWDMLLIEMLVFVVIKNMEFFCNFVYLMFFNCIKFLIVDCIFCVNFCIGVVCNIKVYYDVGNEFY